MSYNVFKYNIVDDEIEAVILYYESISYSLGLRVEKEISTALNKLIDHPNHYLYLPDKLHRRIPVKDFPYIFVYII